MTQDAIRVLLVDDHQVVRSGLSFILKGMADIVLVGEASDGAEGVRRCAELQPDVVLMDLIMPEMDGAAATRVIRQAHPEIQIIILTSFEEEGMVQRALQAGAIGYLLKNCSIDELVTAIRNARDGKATLSWEATQALVRSVRDPSTFVSDLTDRELEVLTLMTDGLTNRQIAQRLVVSPNTINAHVRNIFSKLDVTTRTEAVSFALQHNLVSPNS